MLSCANDDTFMATAIAVVVLMFVPIFIPILKKFPSINMSKLTSLGAGLATASIFAFFIPDLVSKIPSVAAHTDITFLKNPEHLTFFVFVAFLIAFCVMYTLEKVAVEYTKNNKEPSFFLFCVHMFVVCSMLVLLASSFPAMAKTSFYIIGVVSVLAAFEIFLEEAGLSKHFSSIYSSEGRVIISLAIVVGWIAGIKLFGHETTVVTLLSQAFAMGMILTAIVKCEFDLINQDSNYIIFVVSVIVKTCIIYALILVGDAKKEEAAIAEAHLTTVNAQQLPKNDVVASNENNASYNQHQYHNNTDQAAHTTDNNAHAYQR